MSLDAEAMLEVNRQAIYQAARKGRDSGQSQPVVVSVATFGRGIKQEILQELDRFRHAWGHNQSVVAAPPRDWLVANLGIQLDEPQSDDGFQVIGYAFGKSCQRWWRWDDEDGGDLF